MAVNLVIKSAAQTVDDFEMHCELLWTIGHIKEQITELYPTKPKKENQKLIYGGKLLPDHLSLKSILNPSQERHIMHLVCPAPEKKSQESKKETTTQSFPVPPPDAAFPPLSQPVLNTQGLSGIPPVSVVPFAAGDAFQQYLAMQQMYAQFMTQYFTQYNGGVPPVLPYSPVTTVPPVQTPQVSAPQQNIPRNRPQRVEREENHDMLDLAYIFSRAMILFAILFYYSSFLRVLVVVGMFILFSVYRKINRQNQQEEQRLANERQRSEAAASQSSGAAAAAADIQAENQEIPRESESSTNAVSEQPEGRSVIAMISLTVSIISSFFTSLIPADPVPVNVN